MQANVEGKLHAVNAKKRAAIWNGASTNRVAFSFEYSISDLIDDVKDVFNDTFGA